MRVREFVKCHNAAFLYQAQPQTSVAAAAAAASSPNIALLSSGSSNDSGYTTLKPQESSSLKVGNSRHV